MRIIIITGSLYNKNGGPYFSVRSLAKGFLEQGHEVLLFGTKDNFLDSNIPEGYIDLLNDFKNLKLYALKKIGSYNLHFTPSLIAHFLKIGRADVVFLQGVWMLNCWMGFFCSKILGISTVFSIRGEFNDAKSLSRFKVKFALPAVRFMLNACDYVHVLNKPESSVLFNYGISNKVNIIPNGVFESEFSDSVKNDSKIILFLGRLHPIKNVENLVLAWKSIELKGWTLIVAGSGDRHYEDTLIHCAGANSSIKFIGHADEKMKDELLERASWFILPSLSEGMPMAVLEAMSHNIPCVISAFCNLDDFVNNDEAILTGVAVNEIANAIIYCSKLSEIEKSIMVNKMRKRLKSNYSWRSITEKMLNELNK
jgi:poly(glycerol-phosphate) alpha-glucosyltransferase